MGLTGLWAGVVLACIVTGICAKNRAVRVTVWCTAGTLLLVFVLFLLLALPRILPR